MISEALNRTHVRKLALIDGKVVVGLQDEDGGCHQNDARRHSDERHRQPKLKFLVHDSPPSNRYPKPNTVLKYVGFLGSGSTLFRRFFTCWSIVRSSPE